MGVLLNSAQLVLSIVGAATGSRGVALALSVVGAVAAFGGGGGQQGPGQQVPGELGGLGLGGGGDGLADVGDRAPVRVQPAQLVAGRDRQPNANPFIASDTEQL
jgi:hypothetical protein